MMHTTTRLLVPGLLVILAACAAPAPTTTVAANACAHEGSPPVPRPNLPPGSLKPNGDINWPQDNGFGSPKMQVVIQPGTLLDRYGDNAGYFLSPQGTGYRQRALPWQCQGYTYHTYKVITGLPATVGTIAPAFGEPGSGIQVLTTPCIGQLLATGVLQPVPDSTAPACPTS